MFINRRFLTGLAFGLAMSGALTAVAAEITFYEYPGFAGQSMTLRGYTANFADVGFNDRASSIFVRSGTWQICTDADFKGTCSTLNRGEYRSLDSKFDGRISSARDVGSYLGETGNYSSYGRGRIELFEEAGFRGRSVLLDRDTVNLASIGFNDRASSMIVYEGTWELCVHAEYRGACRTFGNGRYPDLGPGMTSQISSARLAGGYNDAPVVIGGSMYPPPVGDRAAGNRPPNQGRLILYSQDRFGGRSMALTENMVDLGAAGYNGEAASAIIESGYWEVCSDHYFRGDCRVLGPGRHVRLEGAVYRSISSVRFVGGRLGPTRPDRTRADVVLFEHDDFAGRRFEVRADVPDLAPHNFNDLVSSIIVYAGQWQVCVDALYSGRCVVYGPGEYRSVYGLNDQISSVRRVAR